MSDEAERERIARDRYLEMNDNGPEWSAVPSVVRERYLAEADDVLAASPPRRTRMPAALGAEYGGDAPQPDDPYATTASLFLKVNTTTYAVVRATRIEKLEQKVNENLAAGWEVTGGVTMITGDVYAQAMIRREIRR